jgi:hypothetical protein
MRLLSGATLGKQKSTRQSTIGEKEDAEARMKAMWSKVDALKICVNSINSLAERTTLLQQELIE